MCHKASQGLCGFHPNRGRSSADAGDIFLGAGRRRTLRLTIWVSYPAKLCRAWHLEGGDHVQGNIGVTDMSAGRTIDDARPPTLRSRVTNGSALFLGGVDGRSATARRFRDLIAAMTSDLGGADLLSEGQRQLIRRAAALAVECERGEARMAGGKSFDLPAYIVGANALRRILVTLGLERRAAAEPRLADVLRGKAA